ncbi:hypothetical protein [Candidatus Magnetomonas plexicatena]|uniref:hypothetical protein n=1 Tax=Candidatus Magnetomonas plexicatena TaxID=2552947 RepID=UPI001C77F0DB|nr:hypothetical protein E2O03_003620 [Nitrospirales bacterium LBB_01]
MKQNYVNFMDRNNIYLILKETVSDATTEDRVMCFINERLDMIASGNTPFPINGGPKVALHILPINAFTSQQFINFSNIELLDLSPINSLGYSPLYNAEGFATYSDKGNLYYCQLYRNGLIESVRSNIAIKKAEKIFIPANDFEKAIVEAIITYINTLKKVKILSPIIVIITLLDVKDVFLGTHSGHMERSRAMDRNALMLPCFLIKEDSSASELPAVARLLKPTFEVLWNAFGFSCCHNFDKEGNYVGGLQ